MAAPRRQKASVTTASAAAAAAAAAAAPACAERLAARLRGWCRTPLDLPHKRLYVPAFVCHGLQPSLVLVLTLRGSVQEYSAVEIGRPPARPRWASRDAMPAKSCGGSSGLAVGGSSTTVYANIRAADQPAVDGERPERAGSSGAPQLGEGNIGYQLLKKAGWKEDRGLGAAEQGQLRPVSARLKRNKLGIGAEDISNVLVDSSATRLIGHLGEDKPRPEKHKATGDSQVSLKKSKKLSKRARAAALEEERSREQALARALYRDFHPDNV
eukprot:SM000090S24326  [mRNA]  locus=s90:324415:325990:+ [translate_table: standard]